MVAVSRLVCWLSSAQPWADPLWTSRAALNSSRLKLTCLARCVRVGLDVRVYGFSRPLSKDTGRRPVHRRPAPLPQQPVCPVAKLDPPLLVHGVSGLTPRGHRRPGPSRAASLSEALVDRVSTVRFLEEYIEYLVRSASPLSSVVPHEVAVGVYRLLCEILPWY